MLIGDWPKLLWKLKTVGPLSTEGATNGSTISFSSKPFIAIEPVFRPLDLSPGHCCERFVSDFFSKKHDHRFGFALNDSHRRCDNAIAGLSTVSINIRSLFR